MASKQMKAISVLFCVLSGIVLVSLVMCGVVVYKMWYMEGVVDNDPSLYTNKNMTKYDGGADAIEFFPQYEALDNIRGINIIYQDNRPKSTIFHHYYSFFMLDIYYEENYYQEYKLENMRDNAKGNVGEFYLLKESNDSDCICKAVFCNDDKHVIRYIIFYGDFGREASIMTLIAWNAPYF